jgi:streptomycin 6-kinase
VTEIAEFLALWHLEPEGRPFRTATSTVQFATQDGKPCVLKLAHRNSDELTAQALARYAGRGAVMLLAHAGHATLMQRATPGTPLSSLVIAGSDDEATRHLCSMMTALHGQNAPGDGFRHVEDWGTGFARAAAASLPSSLVGEAARIYGDLCRSQGRRVLLQGDLHHDNILSDADKGWLAIDPKGIIGESAFETGAALRNPTEDVRYFASPGIIDRRVKIMCPMMGWPRDRVLRWCFAQAVLSAIWSLEDGESPARGLAVADATRPLI